jgi:hypothetical protein
VSVEVRAAAVIGCGSPIIAVAPALIQHLTADELDRVAIHEWAHVQRGDDLATAVQLTVRALAGWHPAVWWLDRRLRAEREAACDEMTVALTGSSKAYAACLLKLASLPFGGGDSLPALGVLSSPSLTTRIDRIVSRTGNGCWVRSRIICVVVLAGISIAVGSLRIVEAVVASSERTAVQVVYPLKSSPAAADNRYAIADASVRRQVSSNPRTTVAFNSLARTREPRLEVSTPESIAARSNDAVLDLASSPPPTASGAPALSAGSPAVEATNAASPDPLLQASPIQMADVTRAVPWRAAAGAGIAIGQRSKDGGLATARLFSRFGKQIADSF